MWFKNIRFYRFRQPFNLTPDALEKYLAPLAFNSCPSHQPFSIGWVPPMGRHGSSLVHSANGNIMLTMAKEERILPGAVVNAEVDKKVIEIQDKESRKVGRKEKQEIKDEVTMAMLPKAFTRMSKVSLYIAPQDNWMVIDASSANKADEVIALLRKALGTLAIYPPNVKHAPTAMMTSWLKDNDIPSGVGIGESCELKSADEEESTVRCSKQDLMADEVKNHIECGKMVTKLQLNYQDHIDFVLQDDMSVRRIKFADDITKELDDLESDDVAGRFDAEFSIMTLELNPLLTSLLDWFGGEEEQPV